MITLRKRVIDLEGRVAVMENRLRGIGMPPMAVQPDDQETEEEEDAGREVAPRADNQEQVRHE